MSEHSIGATTVDAGAIRAGLTGTRWRWVDAVPRTGSTNVDLSTDLNHDPRLAIFRQTDNGIPVRMALFAVLMGVENQIARNLRDVTWRSPAFVGPDDAVFDTLD